MLSKQRYILELIPPSFSNQVQEKESLRILLNAKLVDECIKMIPTGEDGVFTSLTVKVHTDEFRKVLPNLYNELWDAALVHKKTKLDVAVHENDGMVEKNVIYYNASKEIDGTCNEQGQSLSLSLSDELKLASSSFLLYDNTQQVLPKLKKIALGGTFDRIHNGHKKLLTIALHCAVEEVVIGVTSELMLKSKKNANEIQPVTLRCERVKEFCESFLKSIKKKCTVRIVIIDDPFGPTTSEQDLQGVVVSSETIKGALMINQVRIEQKKFPPLLPLVVLRSNCHVLSSSFIRQNQL